MPKRTDANQQEIMDKLREIGATVQDLHIIGKGCPDILVGYRGVNFLMEIKNGDGKLNDKEAKWHEGWRGQVVTVWAFDDAMDTIVRAILQEAK